MSETARYMLYAIAIFVVAAAGYTVVSRFAGSPPPHDHPAELQAAASPPAQEAPVKVAQPVEDAKVARPALCMSDDELRLFLKQAAIGPIRYGARTCSERFPDLKEEADRDVDALQAKHGEFLKSLDERSMPAFTRSYGPDDTKQREARVDVSLKPTFQRILTYSRDECKSHLAAIEGFGQLPDGELDTVLTNIARQSWEDQRAAMPACG
jgi:hypothetical protein